MPLDQEMRTATADRIAASGEDPTQPEGEAA